MNPSEWVPTDSPDSSYASSRSSGGSEGGTGRCEISLLERLIRSHPLWFIPSLQRSGALHLLQGKEIGSFIVRGSREPNTMAVSVKLPGNTVEHYLVRAGLESRIALQDSLHSFPSVPQLIAHYCEHSDEIPVKLRIPSAVAEADTRQQLRSLALLGQEFWILSIPQGCPSPDPDSHPAPTTSKSSGVSSLSSSSQNSLSESSGKPRQPRPLRPTSLKFGGAGGRSSGRTPQSVPTGVLMGRWPPAFSQPSSLQSTPSEPPPNFSRQKRRNNKTRSIHYKDTEIIDLFKGTKTLLEDKVSDYEELCSWSSSHPATPNTPNPQKRLFTFKPDLIPRGNNKSGGEAPQYSEPVDVLRAANKRIERRSTPVLFSFAGSGAHPLTFKSRDDLSTAAAPDGGTLVSTTLEHKIRGDSASSSSWAVDNSWKFSSKQETEGELNVQLEEEEQARPLSRSPHNWDHLLDNAMGGGNDEEPDYSCDEGGGGGGGVACDAVGGAPRPLAIRNIVKELSSKICFFVFGKRMMKD